jgi:DNA topoisomerase-1
MLVIVESPTKAKKIQSFLKNATVRASFGHVRDLPEKELGVEVEKLKQKGFPLRFVITKKKVVSELKRLAKGEKVLCATDPDREGEAIAWHLKELLKGVAREIKRIEFNEITKKAVLESLKKERDIDYKRVESYFSRRTIDRLVGYKVSPELWKEFRKNYLSAGRVQSAVLYEIVKREREIRNFTPKPYWKLSVKLKGTEFETENFWKKELAEKNLNSKKFRVVKVKRKTRREPPPPPLVSSTLQQLANKLYGLSPERTMSVAQKLFEQGIITYHRTESERISEEGIKKLLKAVEKFFGNGKRRQYKAKGYDAHECIRPTDPELTPERLKGIERKVYELIWKRSLASQMEDAVWEEVEVVVENEFGTKFKAKGRRLVEEGWRKLFPEKDKEIGEFKEGEEFTAKPKLLELKTKPPERYTEAGIVKWMEKTGVGRPSTFAQVVATLKKRGYVKVKRRTLYPTTLGERVIEFLEKTHPQLLSPSLTAEVEKNLDLVCEGKMNWKKAVLLALDSLNVRL